MFEDIEELAIWVGLELLRFLREVKHKSELHIILAFSLRAFKNIVMPRTRVQAECSILSIQSTQEVQSCRNG